MFKKQELGQFYTTNSEYIVGNLIDIFKDGYTVVDPFAGNWDLLSMLDAGKVNIVGYDIDPVNSATIKQDTLDCPPDFSGRWIFTNPPFLARNKAKNKLVYDKYDTDDLYKIALSTIANCDGGIIIVPLNFLSSKDSKIRIDFLSKFRICNLNVFEEQVFSDTSYTVCSFSFVKCENEEQDISIRFFPSGENLLFCLKKSEGYRIGADFFHQLSSMPNTGVSRLLIGQTSNSNIFLRALDTGGLNGRIGLEMRAEPYYGKNTDRAFATVVLPKELTITQQEIVVAEFNKILEENRTRYHSMFLSAFRNSTQHYSRKRMSFDDAYGLIRSIIINNGFDQ